MKKILITGGNGYIAKSIVAKLSKEHEVTIVTRADFDLTDFKQTNAWFKGNYFDAVVHTAAVGGSRLQQDNTDVLNSNLMIHYNLLSCRDHFSRLIGFGSGAETFAPETPYGLSKRVIANSIKETPNWYNIRIFGVFDENELPTRFIKANINRYLQHQPMKIHKDKIMDFFYMRDLVSVVDKYLVDKEPPKEVDCSYREKHSLVDIAAQINQLANHEVPIDVQENGMSFYCGQELKLDVPLIGFSQGLRNTFNAILNKENVL